MTKARLLVTAILLSLAFFTVSAAPKFSLNYADWNPPQASISKITAAMIKRIEKNSKGRIKINAYYSGSLLKQTEVYRGVQQGMADMAYFGPNIPGSPVKLGDLIALPFLGITDLEMTRVVYERLFQESPELQAEYKGVLVKGIFGIPCDNLHLKNKLVRVPADMKGMKVLTLGSRTDFMSEVGAVPVMLSPGEWYTSLDKGLVEALYFVTPVLGVFKIEKQFKYHTVINGSGSVNMFIFNERKWKKIPADLQAIMEEAMRWRIKESREFDFREEKRIYTMLRKRGNTVYYPTFDEIRLWEKAAKPVHERWIKSAEANGVPGRILFDRMMKIIADVKQSAKK